jgi:hypothetical protein
MIGNPTRDYIDVQDKKHKYQVVAYPPPPEDGKPTLMVSRTYRQLKMKKSAANEFINPLK